MSGNLSIGDEFGEPKKRPQHKPERPTPVIPLEDLVDAQRDSSVAQFHMEAKAEGDELKLKGFIHH